MSNLFANQGDQTPPYSQEAEEATIGALITFPGALLGVAEFLHDDDFFLLRNRYIWKAMNNVAARSEPIEYITLVQELDDMGKLDEVGGPAYITHLINAAPSAMHAEVYGRLVERAATRRQLMAASDQIKALALNKELSIEQVLDRTNKIIFDITTRPASANVQVFHDLVSDYYDKVERLLANQQTITGQPTGFKDLDNVLGGLQRTDLTLVAGRPGMGKSSFLLSVVMNMLRAAPGKRIALFTLEMSAEQLVQRAMSLEAGINLRALRAGQIGRDGWANFVRTAGKISPYTLFIDDRPGLTPAQIRAACRRLVMGYGPLDIIVVDYVQLMKGGSFKPSERVQEIGFISKSLKALAKEFDVPVLVAAQLSRAVEQRQNKRPVLSDLRESGDLENDADIVMFLYRDEVYNENTEFPNEAEVIVAKHRNGPTGTISLYFEKTLTRFTDMAVRTVDLRNMVVLEGRDD